MNYFECIPLTLFDRITVWIIKIKRERKGSANKKEFIVSFIVLPIHLLPIHLLPIQSMCYKSSPLHSSPCFTTCLYFFVLKANRQQRHRETFPLFVLKLFFLEHGSNLEATKNLVDCPIRSLKANIAAALRCGMFNIACKCDLPFLLKVQV